MDRSNEIHTRFMRLNRERIIVKVGKKEGLDFVEEDIREKLVVDEF